MKKNKSSNFSLYNLRYQIGYAILFLSYIGIILYSIFIAPNGISQAEMNSTVDSVGFSINNLFSGEILNLPYKILQKISIHLFGLNNLSIKLPSILLSSLSLFGILELSRVWFKSSLAVFASIIAIASGQFFFLSQNGTPEILYIFYPLIIILAGAFFIEQKNLISAIILSLTVGMSLYTPLSFYVILAFLATVIAHPHLRFIAKREISKKHFSTIIGIFMLTISPLVVAIFKNSHLIGELIGAPSSLNIVENFNHTIGVLFGFNSNISGIVSPIISPPILLLIIVGIYFTKIAFHTAKSYALLIWLTTSFIVAVINPSTISILFVPTLLMTASGLQGLIQTWYTIFPRNPYARIAGLIPTALLVISLLATNLRIFQQNYIYTPSIVNYFNHDLKLLAKAEKLDMMVSIEEQRFYDIYTKKNNLKLVNNFSDQKIVLTHQAYKNIELPTTHKIEKIITSANQENSDRFYIITKK